jgi:hypothetical protein
MKMLPRKATFLGISVAAASKSAFFAAELTNLEAVLLAISSTPFGLARCHSPPRAIVVGRGLGNLMFVKWGV